jgi:DNA repair exonuclease SbcCD nuclease subunit
MKGLYFTDIHFGRKDNSVIHNTDCLNFIEYIVGISKTRGDIDYIAFLGDWHQSRVSLHQTTLHYSSMGVECISQLNIPFYMVCGNHDMLYRDSREIISTRIYRYYPNVQIIDNITVVQDNKLLLVPFLTHGEYEQLQHYVKYPVWAGHFEFDGFTITGYNITMKDGPSHHPYKQVTNILSGHFHKRQQTGNVTYIGNTFPMDYGDTGDNERGYAIYDHDTHQIEFGNWEHCPKYQKIKITELDNNTIFDCNSHVKCIIDTTLTYEDQVRIQEQFVDDHKVREFSFEDNGSTVNALKNTDGSLDGETNTDILSAEEGDEVSSSTVDQQIVTMLSKVTADRIDSSMLVSIFQSI